MTENTQNDRGGLTVLNGTLYVPYAGLNGDSDFNFENRRAAHLSVPLNEYQWGANLNFTYVPVYGKFAGFNKFIFSYDLYVVGGGDPLLQTTGDQPSQEDPNEPYNDFAKLAFELFLAGDDLQQFGGERGIGEGIDQLAS